MIINIDFIELSIIPVTDINLNMSNNVKDWHLTTYNDTDNYICFDISQLHEIINIKYNLLIKNMYFGNESACFNIKNLNSTKEPCELHLLILVLGKYKRHRWIFI